MYHHVGARLTISWAMWGAWSKESVLDERMFLRHYGHPQSLDLSGALSQSNGDSPTEEMNLCSQVRKQSCTGESKNWPLATEYYKSIDPDWMSFKCSWLLHPSARNCIHSLWRCLQYVTKSEVIAPLQPYMRNLMVHCGFWRSAMRMAWWGYRGEIGWVPEWLVLLLQHVESSNLSGGFWVDSMKRIPDSRLRN